jgi:hypothetical protein
MKLTLKSNKQETFDAPRGIGLALIAAGVVEEFVEKPASRKPATTWGIESRTSTEEPHVVVRCGTCGQVLAFYGRLKVAPTFSHCGVNERCPQDVLDAYHVQHASYDPTTGKPVGDGGAFRLRQQIDSGDDHLVFVRK